MNYHQRIASLFLILFLGIINSVVALDMNESLSTKLLRKQTPTIATLDRGVEDGIEPGDHARLTASNGFITRAVAIKADLKTSHWKLYQILNPRALRSGESYQLTYMSPQLMPPRIKAMAENISIKKERRKNKEARQKIAADSDSGIASSFNINAEDMKEDLSSFDVSLSASPISFSTENDAQELSYSANVSNTNKEKYELETNYSYTKSQHFNPDLNREESSSSSTAGIVFDINKIYGDFTYFGILEFSRVRENTIYPIRKRITGGLTGIKYDLYESSKIPDFSISYIPLLEYQVAESIDYLYDENTGDSTEYVRQESTNKIRHSFRLRIKAQPTENLSLKNTFYWKPFHDIPNNKFDTTDTLTENEFILSYMLGQNASISYNNNYSWDILRKRNQSEPSSIMTHSFTVGVNFTL